MTITRRFFIKAKQCLFFDYIVPFTRYKFKLIIRVKYEVITRLIPTDVTEKRILLRTAEKPVRFFLARECECDSFF